MTPDLVPFLSAYLTAASARGAQMLSLAVAQRTRDIGIRMAIGASRNQVVALIVRDATLLVAAALALGLVAALAASRVLAHYLYGVSPRDPLTFTVTLALLALTAAPRAGCPRGAPARSIRW
jgi:ABC-type antimicrobial peptide transport system permease subunit